MTYETIRVLDAETTGLPEDGGRLVELAWNDVSVSDRAVGPIRSTLVNPCHPIPPQASAVHHIVDADVIGAPVPMGAVAMVLGGWHPAMLFASHNRRFDQHFVSTPGATWLCTYRITKRVIPNAPTHSNQGLRYYTKLEVDPVLSMPPHRAPADVHVTTCLLVRLLAKYDLDDLIRWSQEPVYMPTLEFGNKHRGQRWADVPTDYLRWMAFEADKVDEDSRENALLQLKDRGF